MEAAIVLVDLGLGDAGKGASTDALVRRLNADLVVRYSGGSNAGHSVQLPNGTRHTFSQFGAGTFAGARTYLGPAFIINLEAFRKEAVHLKEIGAPFNLMVSAHPDCLVSTFFHRVMNQLREIGRGAGRHGSCGHGIGETRGYWLRHGQDAIFLKDMDDPGTLRQKLELLRQRLIAEVQELPTENWVPSIEYRDTARCLLEPVTEHLVTMYEIARSIPRSHLMPMSKVAVFEGSQGTLLDEHWGFHPHTTWSTVTAHHAHELLAGVIPPLRIINLGITRAYSTRHGAGPFPTEDRELGAALSDPGNPDNRWQGSMRFGPLDLPLLRYGAEVAMGGEGSGAKLDGIIVNHLDQYPRVGRVCTRYIGWTGLRTDSFPNLVYQARLGESLERVCPEYKTMDEVELLGRISEACVAPVVIEGSGPTWQDRTFKGDLLS